jgi:peptide/nickel transport system permease protein
VPAGGFPGWNAGIWPGLKGLILPAIALALPQAAILARVTRSALLEVLGEDYIRTARAKGLPRRRVLLRHALRNGMIPVMTILGLQFASFWPAQSSSRTSSIFPASAGSSTRRSPSAT